MASEQWLLNDTSVNPSSFFTAVGSSYKLQNVNTALSRTTTNPTPYEGAGCYRSPNTSEIFYFCDSGGSVLTGATYYLDTYVYTRSSTTDEGYVLNTGNDSTVEYVGAAVNGAGALGITTYDTIDGLVDRSWTASGVCPDDAWFRVQVKAIAGGISEIKLFKGTNINGTTADNTVTYAAAYTSFERLYGGGAYSGNGKFAYDNIKFDNTAYPTRGGTAHTVSGTSTITATGTAAMSNARVGAGSSTETATGTAAASNQRALAGTSSVTASATAAMSSTQVIGGSGTGTASGSAAGAITAVVTISGSATITGTGTSTASVAMAQTATAIGTVIATSSVDFIVIPPITLQSNGTVIADSSGEMAKTMPVESTGTATATSQAGATHIYYIFNPPTREIAPLSLDPYAELVGYYQGKTLVKRDGVWKLVQNKRQDWLDQCEYVFPGGRENRVNGTQKTELESAGYTVETRIS